MGRRQRQVRGPERNLELHAGPAEGRRFVHDQFGARGHQCRGAFVTRRVGRIQRWCQWNLHAAVRSRRGQGIVGKQGHGRSCQEDSRSRDVGVPLLRSDERSARAVWFFVRRYSTGATEVETVVENGWLNVAAPTAKSYTATVAVNGSTRYGPAALTHLHHTRWSRVDWVGTDPAVTPSHDGAYLRSTKLVPNYTTAYGAPSSTTLNSLVQTADAFRAGSVPKRDGSGRRWRLHPEQLGGPLRHVWGCAGLSLDNRELASSGPLRNPLP